MNDWNNAPLQSAADPQRDVAYLRDLNPAQRAAVETLDGPVLMLAGAGTGKTKALTTRIVHLLHCRRAHPGQILAVTFTNKAAREMKTRIAQLLGREGDVLPWMGTFHGLCAKILRRHAELVGLRSNFTILDKDDQIRLLKPLISVSGVDEKRWPARLLAGIIDAWKNRAYSPQSVPSAEAHAFNNYGTDLYEQYQARLQTLNAVDFGDLLLHCVTIFQKHPDVLAEYQRRFRYLLVDEYQDTNVAQYMWLRLLAQAHHNICCVGDDDQSIYGWRGAEVENILRFEHDFPGAQVVRLEQNYRSTGHILGAATQVISANEGRLGKKLWTADEAGEKVRIIGHWDSEEEARFIGEEAEAYQRGTRGMDPIDLNQQAVLVRAGHQMRAFEERFLSIGLPYRVIGGPRFYERQEIRDAMAYLRVAVSPDDDLAFERIFNTPKRGLGDKAQAEMRGLARKFELGLVQASFEAVTSGAIGGKGAGRLRALIEQIKDWHQTTRENGYDHIELAEKILDQSGYTSMWVADKSPDAPGRLDNLKELIKALETFDNLQGFLEHVSLIMENDREDAAEKITIMTLHAAKGLEFPVVFLPGWEDGLFPSQRSMDESGQKGLEEERRLAYVGITRAERLCTISYASNRRVYGQWQSQLPSRFIDELPEEHIDNLTMPGLYGGGYGAASARFGSTFSERVHQADVYNSPGWRRLQQHQTNVQTPRIAPSGDVSDFELSERVFHQNFGYGTITAIEGDKLDIDFDQAGAKKIVARFAQKASV